MSWIRLTMSLYSAASFVLSASAFFKSSTPTLSCYNRGSYVCNLFLASFVLSMSAWVLSIRSLYFYRVAAIVESCISASVMPRSLNFCFMSSSCESDVSAVSLSFSSASSCASAYYIFETSELFCVLSAIVCSSRCLYLSMPS